MVFSNQEITMKRIIIGAILFSSIAQARAYHYDCFSYFWNGSETQKGVMELSVNARKAWATIRTDVWEQGLTGELNTQYRSYGDIPFVKFGNELVVEKSLVSGGRRLRDGNWGGLVLVEGDAEGSPYKYKFICKLK